VPSGACLVCLGRLFCPCLSQLQRFGIS
jgi:hypothetical protein